MTKEQEIELFNFETRVRQLMLSYQEQCSLIQTLKEKLSESEQRLVEAEERIALLQQDYDRLKTARMIEVSGEDIKESRARIARLIREVDKCIALLDV